MPLALQRGELSWLLKIDSQTALTSAGELKNNLLEWLAAEKDLDLDLEDAEEIDLPTLQLLCAASREAERRGTRIKIRSSTAVAAAILDAGFTQIPGFPGAADE